MTTQILQHEQQAWPMVSWVSGSTAQQSCGGSTWSKRVSSAVDSDSWEVRAFAEDASSSGQWPPRSYSCSFCQREFRTAQALGGHMNVHRRERAHANQLAQLRSTAATRLSGASSLQQPPASTVELLSPKSDSMSGSSALMYPHNSSTTVLLSSSPPSEESISSSTALMMQEHLGTTKPFLQTMIPNILSETLSQQQQNVAATLSWTPSPRAASATYHPYEKSSKSAGRFSLCLNKVTRKHESDALVDLELRLGRSSCTV